MPGNHERIEHMVVFSFVVWYTICMKQNLIIHGEGIKVFPIVTAVLVLVIVLPLFGIKYVFYSSHLLVSCGIYGKERIEYRMIRQIKETRNPLSSAAMSLDRLQIDYLENGVRRTVLISPVYKKEFIEKLEQYRKL